jgi:hypothetical protein
MFLTEQGYSYEILDEKEVLPPAATPITTTGVTLL